MKRATIIIPVKDEEESLALLLDEIERVKPKIPFLLETIVVDDHSRDRTSAVISQKGAVYLKNDLPVGKGNALRYGFSKAKGDYIVMMDGDFSHCAEDIPKLLILLENGAGLVIGSRILAGTDEYSPIRALGNVFFSLAINILFKQQLTDCLNGFKAFKSDLIRRADYTSQDYEIEIELLANAVRLGYRIEEVPAHERRRYAGEVKSKIIFHGLKFLFRLIRETVRGTRPRRGSAKTLIT